MSLTTASPEAEVVDFVEWITAEWCKNPRTRGNRDLTTTVPLLLQLRHPYDGSTLLDTIFLPAGTAGTMFCPYSPVGTRTVVSFSVYTTSPEGACVFEQISIKAGLRVKRWAPRERVCRGHRRGISAMPAWNVG